MSVIHKLPPFQNVAANATAVLPALPLGMTYEGLLLQLGGTSFTKAHLTALRIWLGGKKIWEISGAALDAINQYLKLPNAATFLPVWFADPLANNPADFYAGAIDTSLPYSNFYIEADIGGATAPTLTGYAMLSQPQSRADRTKGMIRAMLKSNHAPSAANEFELPIPLGSAGSLVRGVHYAHTNITKIQVLKDNFPLVQEGVNAVLQFAQGPFRTAQSGYISFDPIYKNDLADAVPTMRADGRTPATFQHKVTVSGADNITAYSDILTTVPNL